VAILPGDLPRAERRSASPRHLLSLTGGGFRGLFSARVLSLMEAEAGRLISKPFDLIAGTSIGGILAIGIAAEIPAETLVKSFRKRGSSIFRPKLTSFGGFTAARYDSESLRSAVEAILGPAMANRPFRELPVPLLIVAINEQTSEPKLFRTLACDPASDDTLSTLDVALATSAAPTFFAPHKVNDRMFVDGGLVANAPDMLLVTEAQRTFGCALSDLHLCSVGTAHSPRVGAVSGKPGKIGWMMRHELIELIMDTQQALVADQIAALSLATALRIEARPATRIDMDDVSKETITELLNLADQAVATAKATRLGDWRRFLAHHAAA